MPDDTTPRTVLNGTAREICQASIQIASRVCGVSVPQILAGNRGRKPIAQARQIAMYVAHVEAGLTMRTVGQHFGRDRTTVGHACRMVEDWRDQRAFDQWLTRHFGPDDLARTIGQLRRRRHSSSVTSEHPAVYP